VTPPRSPMPASRARRIGWLRRSAGLLLLLGGAILSSCARDSAPAARTEVSLFAAASLVDAFGALESAFEHANPDIDVRATFAGSQVLRLQIEQGATAHLVASANEGHMRALMDGGFVDTSRPLGSNELVLIVPRDNPAGITSFRDLPSAQRIVIGTPGVPVGSYTRELLGAAAEALGPDFERAVLSRVVSEESNVRLVRAKVELGEADAAVVYRTDALASDRVRLIEIPTDYRVRARYLIGVTTEASSPDSRRTGISEAVERLLAFAYSEEGTSIMARHGFGEADR
jgi:molybdate transport system substrate-binding protein